MGAQSLAAGFGVQNNYRTEGELRDHGIQFPHFTDVDNETMDMNDGLRSFCSPGTSVGTAPLFFDSQCSGLFIVLFLK